MWNELKKTIEANDDSVQEAKIQNLSSLVQQALSQFLEIYHDRSLWDIWHVTVYRNLAQAVIQVRSMAESRTGKEVMEEYEGMRESL